MSVALTVLAVFASNLTGGTCAAIDNTTNTAAWKVPGSPVVASRYTDMDRLTYRPAPGPTNNAAWLALHTAEAKLAIGKPGPKRRLACV